MEEKTLLLATLVFPIKNGKVLLAKKGGKIGAGCWNGYGGGVEENETLEECALRELEQESRLKGALSNLHKIAIADFHNTKKDGTTFVCRVHCYTLNEPVGIPQETEEMLNPSWHYLNDLPFEQMMPADRYWLPRALIADQIYVVAHYGPHQKELLKDVEIRPLLELIELP